MDSAFSAVKYKCDFCHITCDKTNDWTRHLATNKHKRKSGINVEIKITPSEYICKCNKKYTTKSGLWKHNKVCNYEEKEEITTVDVVDKQIMGMILKENMDFKNLILEVVRNNSELQRQNQEFQVKMMELYTTTSQNMVINTNTNNSHNKTFNMQVFLNEQCKDAMDIKEFIDSFQFEFADLENIGDVGYVQGISDIIVKKLSAMDICKRPIHCSDLKRETVYVHENNVWVKDNDTHDRLRLVIRYIAKKNSDLLTPWYNANPGVGYSEHRLNDKYMHMVMQAM